jgi:phage host-nuclease inhibitor protein Gam
MSISNDEQAIERVISDIDESFHVRDEQSANWVLRKIVEERAYRQRVQQWCDAETRRSERREQFLMLRFGAELAEWTKQQLQKQFGKRRSIHLPSGTLGFRTTPPKLVVADESRLITWCRRHLPSAIKIVEHVLKSEVHSHIKTTGEVPEGAEISGGEDRFFVK